MKRPLCFSILLAALAVPAVQAESTIVKCVDSGGRITLTDQPCDAGATTVRLASMPADEGVTRIQPYPLVAEAAVLPAPVVRRHVAMPRTQAKPLTQDVATLKAARAQFLMADAVGKPTLATLD